MSQPAIRVLIVDDEPAIRRALRPPLMELGFQIAEASRGEEALQLLHSTPVDVVLLDLRPDDLRAAVESAAHQLDATAARRGVTVTIELPEAPVRIRHDPQRIGQVVANPLGNAIPLTPPGRRAQQRQLLSLGPRAVLIRPRIKMLPSSVCCVVSHHSRSVILCSPGASNTQSPVYQSA